MAVKVGKTPYVRFDLNDYSVPHTHVRRTLTVLADPDRLRIVEGQDDPRHPSAQLRPRRADRDPAHLQALVAVETPGPPATARPIAWSRPPRPVEPCCSAPPSAATTSATSPRPWSSCWSATGASQLDAAIIEALDRDVPHPNAVRLALERRRDDRRQAPPVALILPAHVRARDKAVRPHSLDTYDQLRKVGHEEP